MLVVFSEMYLAIISVVSIFCVLYLKNADCAVFYQCFSYSSNRWGTPIKDNAVTNNWCENQCKAKAENRYSGTISDACFCRTTTPSSKPQHQHSENECNWHCPGNNSEMCGGSNKRITVSIIANEEWGMWNDWTFCEVNCVREDTTNGTQRRWRTCNDSECSGKDMEERACSEPDICKGMRPTKLLCKCPKRLINTKWHFLDGMNITDAEVKKIVIDDFNKNIKSEISVDKKTVSKEIRKKNSSVDKRKSSQSIGWGCIVFFVLPMVFLIAIDILNCCIHFLSRFGGRKRIGIIPISITQDQRDSTTPLQENVNDAESYYASRCGNAFHPDEMKRETYQRRRDDNNQLGRDEWLQYM